MSYKLIVFLAFPVFSFAQTKVFFFDITTNLPIQNVMVYDVNNQLQFISNYKGEIVIDSNENRLLKAKNNDYKDLTWKGNQQTKFFLEPNGTELDEVVITGLTNEQLYTRILQISSSKALENNFNGSAKYYNGIYKIDKALGDTNLTSSLASFNFESQLNKRKSKRNFSFFPLNGKKERVYFGQKEKFNNKFDSIIISGEDALLMYDLSDIDPFQLVGDKVSTSRIEDSVSKLEFIFKNEKVDYKTTVYYSKADTTLLDYSWLIKTDHSYRIINAHYEETDSVYCLKSIYQEYFFRSSQNYIAEFVYVQCLIFDDIRLGDSDSKNVDPFKPSKYLDALPSGLVHVERLISPSFLKL